MTDWEVGPARRVLVADVIVSQEYIRLGLDDDTVELYRHVIRHPSQHLPPIIVGSDRYVHTGRHRLEAYRLESLLKIEAEVEESLSPKCRLLRAYELDSRNALSLTAADRQHAMALMTMMGCTVKEIAAQTPYSEKTVRLLTKDARDKKRATLVDFIMHLYDTGGYTQKEIAAKAGVSESTVRRIIEQFQNEQDVQNEILEDNEEPATDEDEDVEEPEEETSESKANNKNLTKANNACRALLTSFDGLGFVHVTDFEALDQFVHNLGLLERRLPTLRMAAYIIAEEHKQTSLEAMIATG